MDEGFIPTEKTITQQEPERYQWMRNKEGGQEVGTQTEIYLLTEDLYNRYIVTAEPGPTPLNAFNDHGIAAAKYLSFSRWHSDHPEVTHLSLFRNGGKGPWVLQYCGSLERVRPSKVAAYWAKKVKNFTDPEAEEFGKTADSEIPAREQLEQIKRQLEDMDRREAEQ